MEFISKIDPSIRISDFILAMSVLIAALSLVISQYRSRLQEKRQSTIRMLALLVESKHIHDANMFLNKMREEGRKVVREELSDEEHSRVVVLLNYHEQLCTNAMEGNLILSTVVHLRGKYIKALYGQCSDYIEKRRTALNQFSLYQKLEQFSLR